MSETNWEIAYSLGNHNNSWPWSDLVSLYYRNVGALPKINGPRRVLELGSGTCNNYPFWKSLGFEYFGVEQSETAIEIAISKFPNLENSLLHGSFERISLDTDFFDVICDRASVTHCNEEQIVEVISESIRVLRNNGIYFGVDWFSKNHSDFSSASVSIDSSTKGGYGRGQFAGLGQVHFASLSDIYGIFHSFEILEISEKYVKNMQKDFAHDIFASWNFVARVKK